MKKNHGAIILAERAADHARIRAVLREWGYEENEIQRVLKGQPLSRKLDDSDQRSAQLAGAPLA